MWLTIHSWILNYWTVFWILLRMKHDSCLTNSLKNLWQCIQQLPQRRSTRLNSVLKMINVGKDKQLWKSYWHTREWKDTIWGARLRWVEFSRCHYKISHTIQYIHTFRFKRVDTSPKENLELTTVRFISSLTIHALHVAALLSLIPNIYINPNRNKQV
jgi:hypothetical protein